MLKEMIRFGAMSGEDHELAEEPASIPHDLGTLRRRRAHETLGLLTLFGDR
jgi:hypothetical protein